MVLYNILSFVIIYLRFSLSLNNNDMRILNKRLGVISPYAVGLQFIVEAKNTGGSDYEVEITPDQCCLILGPNENKDCLSLELFGGHFGEFPKGTAKVIKLIAPLLEPYGRVGYCSLFLDSTISGQKRITRDKYTIKFDTTIKSDEGVQNRTGIRKCRVDEDPLNNCKPVHCDTYYNGRKPYYHVKTKRCVRVPSCVAIDGMKDILVIYNAEINKCTRSKAIENSDIEFFKNGNQDSFINNIVVLKKKTKIKPPQTLKPPCDFDTADSKSDDDLKEKKMPIPEKKKVHEKAKKKIDKFSWTFWLTIIIAIQCCLICVMVYLLTFKLKAWRKSKNEMNAYYNYNTDPSVTTPLITTTSNIETHTTECPSSVDQQVKYYKTMNDDKVDNIKKSMSDDILSKCINRRNWIRKNDVSQETVNNNYATYIERSIQDVIERQNEETQYQANFSRKFNESRLNFEIETKKPKKTVTVVSSCKTKDSSKDFFKLNRESNFSRRSNDSEKMEHLMSEKELKCTSYSHTSKPNVTGFRPSIQKKNFAYIKTEHFEDDANTPKAEASKSSKTHSRNEMAAKTSSNRSKELNTRKLETSRSDGSNKEPPNLPFIEKSAQAYFSNDSIDDFLSERGMKFLTGDAISKYTFSTDSIALNESATSNQISNKTSKNNIVKRVLSLIHRSAKCAVSSDPGQSTAKPQNEMDVEVLHMSNASLYSSSNGPSYSTVNNKSLDSHDASK